MEEGGFAFETLVGDVREAFIVEEEAPASEVSVSFEACDAVPVGQVLRLATFVSRQQGAEVQQGQGFQQDPSGVRGAVLQDSVEGAEQRLEHDLVVQGVPSELAEPAHDLVLFEEVVVVLFQITHYFSQVRVLLADDEVAFEYFEGGSDGVVYFDISWVIGFL